jgi:hypothetical protein
MANGEPSSATSSSIQKIQIAELKYTLSEIALRKVSLDYPSQAALPDLSDSIQEN